MNVLANISKFVSTYFWFMTGAAITIGYIAILSLMIRKVIHDRALPASEKPGPRPLFYLGQAYLAFMWPVPLFLILEALDLLR